MKKVMKKSVIRQRKAEVLLLFFSLAVLSVVYIVLLSSDYSKYLAEKDEHTLTYEGHSTLPSVSSSFDGTSSADPTEEGAEEDSEGVAYERMAVGHAILLGDADMLSIYSYDLVDVTVCTTSGISAANVLASSFIVPEVSTKERTVEQILNLGDFDTCYLFLGVHEAEWYYEDSFIEYYATLLEEIQELAPDTVIYIHAIPSVSELADAGVSVVATDEHIAELNAKLKALAAEFDGVAFVEL